MYGWIARERSYNSMNTYIGLSLDISRSGRTSRKIACIIFRCSASSVSNRFTTLQMCPLWFRRNLSSLSCWAVAAENKWRLLGQGIIAHTKSILTLQMFESKWIQSMVVNLKNYGPNIPTFQFMECLYIVAAHVSRLLTRSAVLCSHNDLVQHSLCVREHTKLNAHNHLLLGHTVSN